MDPIEDNPEDRVYVVGHVNPDTDAIASAVGYAWLLSRLDRGPAIAARAGPLNPQMAWVMETLDLEPPVLLADASPRFGAVARRLEAVRPDQPLRDAWQPATRARSVVPVVADDGRPHGLITALSTFAFLGRYLTGRPDWERTTLAEVMAVSCGDLADTAVPRFDSHMKIRDALPRILREDHDDFWVVDDGGQYVGVVHKPDALNPPRLRLVLVDHNEPGQSVGALEEAELLEVLDHHRLGNPPTHLPIAFRVEPVGSTSTLVFENMQDAGQTPPLTIAGLLLAGLLSDTLGLTSPTTTDRDHAAAARLASTAFAAGPLAGWTMERFSRDLLHAGAGLAERDPWEIVSTDLKLYEAGGRKFGIAQVEVTDFAEMDARVPGLLAALDRLKDSRGLNFAALMVTDIVGGSSRLLLVSPPPELEALPYPRLPNGTLRARRVVSRKKQLLPAILGLLER